MKTLKKSLLLLFAVITLVAVCCFGASALEESGSCGENVTYTYNSKTKELVISGSGAMTDYRVGNNSPFHHSDINSIIIKNGVTRIGDNAFSSCYNLQNIIIPDSVTSIGEAVFVYCKSLQSITIPDSVTTIGFKAFTWCYNLQNITIPDSVTSIGSDAFYDTAYYKNDNNWENGMLYINHHLIEAKNDIEIIIKQGTKTIGDSAFFSCENLQRVTIPDSVTTIGKFAFYLCENLQNVTIPGSVTTIGESAFEYCEGLQNITIGDSVTTIGFEAFSYCNSLQSVTIPDSVTTIGDSAFAFCDSLQSITIGGSVTTIGKSAFYYCDSLQSVTIPDTVTAIGDYAFAFCDNLQSININKNNKYYSNDEYGVLFNKNKTKIIQYPKGNKRIAYTIPNTVTTIENYAFICCDNLQNVTIPGSVTTIGESAFEYCEGLQNITIGDSVTTIGFEAFSYCNSLQSVTIPDSVTTIGDSAFAFCDSLQSITIGGSVTTIGKSAFYYCDSLQSVTIGNSVTKIGFFAFYCSSLKDVYYCGTKEQWKKISIGSNNNSLTNATIHYHYNNHIDSDSNNWCDICDEYCLSELVETGKCGENVTYNLYEDGMLVISGNGAMTDYSKEDDSPFYCADIKSVVIKNGVTTIDDYTFYWCTSLQSITIPDSVTTIGEYAFFNCISLQSVTVDKDNKYYSNDEYGVLFDKNKINLIQYPTGNKRTAYTIPDSVTSIGVAAFSNCTNLHSITIPDSVINIGDYAFFCCRNLKDVYYKGTKDQWEMISIGSNNSSLLCATIHYNYHIHTYSTTTTTKATTTENGGIFAICTECGDTKAIKTFYAATSITLSKTSYVYDGKNKTPKVTVKDSKGNILVKNTDYKISVASNRSGIGRYTVKVTLMGNYSGTKKLYFYILPGKPATIKSASQTTSSVKLSWSEVPGAVGYTVYRYSPSKKAYVNAGTTDGTSFTVKKLYDGTKYTFRVVAYGETAAGKSYDSEAYALLKTATKTKTPELTKVTASSTKGKAYVYHSNVSGETGYTVYYSTSKDSGFKKYANFNADTTRCDITGLTSGKTYYFKVRTYIKTDSGYVYSPWSAVKSVKVK